MWRPAAGTAGSATGTNAGVVPSCYLAWRIHLCTRFAFTPCDSATPAMDIPGCLHSATIRAFIAFG